MRDETLTTVAECDCSPERFHGEHHESCATNTTETVAQFLTRARALHAASAQGEWWADDPGESCGTRCQDDGCPEDHPSPERMLRVPGVSSRGRGTMPTADIAFIVAAHKDWLTLVHALAAYRTALKETAMVRITDEEGCWCPTSRDEDTHGDYCQAMSKFLATPLSAFRAKGEPGDAIH